MVDFLLDKKSQELLKWGQSFPNPFTKAYSAFTKDQNALIDVPDGAYLITSPDSKRPLVSTYGMGICVAVGLFNLDTKIAAIAHFKTLTNPGSLPKVLHDMQVERNERVRTVIRGGDKEDIFSVRLAVGLLAVIQSLNLDLAGVELFRKGLFNNGFAIDPNDGSILKDATSVYSAKPLDLEALFFAKGPLMRVYDI